jgi:hypothetical protein
MTHIRTSPVRLILATALALAIAGCSSDDGGDPPAPTSTPTVLIEETPPPTSTSRPTDTAAPVDTPLPTATSTPEPEPTDTAAPEDTATPEPPTPTPTHPLEPNQCDEFEFIQDGMQVDLCAPDQTLSPTMPVDVCNPVGAGWVPSQGSFDHLAWQTFVALNWPADLSKGRGEPDDTKSIGAVDGEGNPLPVVWETYKQVYEVFQYDDPEWTVSVDDWNNQEELPPECPQEPGTKVVQHPSKARPETVVDDLGDEVNEAFHGPLVDQNGNLVRYEIRLNRAEFNQIVEGDYYKVGADTTGLIFIDSETDPAGEGAIEVKAAWKVLTDEEWDSGRFYGREIYVYNDAINDTPASCTLTRMGLVGLHIIRKTSRAPDWFWGTWEHVDNVPDPGVGAEEGKSYSFYNADCEPLVTPAICAAGDVTMDPSNPDYQCCPNLQRYPSIGEGGDSYDRERGPIQVTRLEALTGANDCNAAYAKALEGTVWENYVMVSTQWTMMQDGPPFMKTITPTYLRNTTLETYMVSYEGDPPVQQNTSSCIGCHSGGVDNSYIFVAAQNAAPLPTPTVAPQAEE